MLAIASLALYVSTLAPTLTWGWNDAGVDGGELLPAADGFGVPHPPGYPTYMLLLKSFGTLVPLGDFAYRGNLLSAVLTSIAVVTVFAAARRICLAVKPDGSPAVATASGALGAAVFATAPLVWSLATITEVYALNALFAGGLLVIATRLALRPPSERARNARSDGRYLVAFGFLLGIGLGNHLTLLAVGVPLALWLLWSLGWRRLLSPWWIGAFLLGVSVYVYLPLTASRNPAISWGNADTIRGAVWMLSGRPYQEYVFGVEAGSLPGRLETWLRLVFSQFNPLGLFFGLTIIMPLRRRAPRFLYPTLASILVISLYSVTYNTRDFEVLMVPAFLLFSVWLAVGFFWILSTWLPEGEDPPGGGAAWLKGVKPSHQVFALSLLGFALLPAMSVALNYGSQDLGDDRVASNYARSVVDAVPDGSVVLANGDRSVFSLWYMRFVEQPERDIVVVAVPLLQFDWYLRDLHGRYPQRIPLMEESDVVDIMNTIVEHNHPRSKVFSTFRDVQVMQRFELRQFEGLNIIYEATPKASG